jgi:hypothetical protein
VTEIESNRAWEEASSKIKKLLQPLAFNCPQCEATVRAALIKLAGDPVRVSREIALPSELVEQQFSVIDHVHRRTTFCGEHEQEAFAIAIKASPWHTELPDQPALEESGGWTYHDVAALLRSRGWIVIGVSGSRGAPPELAPVPSVQLARTLEERKGALCARGPGAT